jgi:NADH:ubiquinone oxidoreductase subunit 6 (subunit J)
MILVLLLIALLTLVTAVVAMARRNLIHSALLLAVSWAGIAAFYLWAGAEFVAFAQVLVYVGAISMVVLFAVLLTRPAPADAVVAAGSVGRAVLALVAGGAVLGVLIGAVVSTPFHGGPAAAPTITVKQIGQILAGQHMAALLITGVLLTVALIGAVVIAATERTSRKDP